MTSNQDQLKEQFPEAYRDFEIDKLFATLAEALDKDDLMPASKAALLGKLCRYPHKKTADKVYLSKGTIPQALQDEVFPAIESLYKNKKLYIEEKYTDKSCDEKGNETIKIKWRKVDYSEILKHFKITVENSKFSDYDNILNQLRNRCIELFNQEKLLTTNSLIAKQGMTFNIDDLFVPLGLVERQRPSKRQDLDSAELGSRLYQPTENEKNTFYEQQQFFDQVIRDCNTPHSKGKRIAIIGEAGSGKTTLLQKIGDQLLPTSIPIWISLKRKGNQPLHQYLIEDWLRNAAEVLDNVPEEWKTALEELLKSNQVFLLLDGVDEMTTTSPLQAIGEQINQCKIFDSARVILTCRSNLWEDYALPGFDAYQNLYFDYRNQVEPFIDQFFQNSTENKDLGETLKTELRLENKSRIRDLVKNPLRLFLLCYVWILGEGQLPDTQAELYKLFVDNFYKVYQLKGSNFTIPVPKREELEKGLGELSKKALDDKKFLLPKSFIEQYLGHPDHEESLFYLAKKLNLLNCVGKYAENPREDAYAFLHSTFQEYFAALAVDDWNFFLPHDHVDKPVTGEEKRYRIFEDHWKEGILFWFGFDNTNNSEKQNFIHKLVEFNDNCDNFYRYRAYFLAALGLEELKNTPPEFTEQIIIGLIHLGFGFYDHEQKQFYQFHDEISESARKILLYTNRKIAIRLLKEKYHYFEKNKNLLLEQNFNLIKDCDKLSNLFIYMLYQLDPSLIPDYRDSYDLSAEADIENFEDMILDYLGIDFNDSVENLLIRMNQDENLYTRYLIASYLLKFDKLHEKIATNQLLNLIYNSNNVGIIQLAACSLLNLIPENFEITSKAIKVLTSLLCTSSNNIRIQLAQSLKFNLPQQYMGLMISSLIKCIKSNVDNSRNQVHFTHYTVLWHCAQHMSYPEFHQAWHEFTPTIEQLQT